MEATKPEMMDESVKGLGDDLKKKMDLNKTIHTKQMRGGFISVKVTTEYVVKPDDTDYDFEAEGFTIDNDGDDYDEDGNCIAVDPVEALMWRYPFPEDEKHEKDDDDDIVYPPSRAMSPMPYDSDDDCYC